MTIFKHGNNLPANIPPRPRPEPANTPIGYRPTTNRNAVAITTAQYNGRQE